MSHKPSKRTLDNFNFYKEIAEKVEIQGIPLPSVSFDKNGCSAIDAFSQLEAGGIVAPCCEPESLQKVLQAKQYLNLLIKMWAEGVWERTFLIEEFQEDFPWFKKWVWRAVERQSKLIFKEKGTAPTGYAYP